MDLIWGMVTAGWLGCVLSNMLKFHFIGKLTGQLSEIIRGMGRGRL